MSSRRATRARSSSPPGRSAGTASDAAGAASHAPPPIRTVAAAAIGLAAAVLVLYVATAARDIVLGDGAELVTVAATLGVAHPPGYPLLTLLAHALIWLPVGEVAFRANLLSVFAGVGTVLLVYLIGVDVTGSVAAAAVGAALLAVQPLVWEWSLSLEAFSLHACLTMAGAYALMRWDARPDDRRWLLLAAAAGALGIANHHTVIFLAPAGLWIAWRHRARWWQGTTILAIAAIIAGGLALYLYLPWAAGRRPYLNWGDIHSSGALFDHFLRRTYGTLTLTAVPGAAVEGGAGDRLATLARSFTVAEAALVAIGVVVSARRARRLLMICGVTALLAGPGFALAANLDVHVPGYAWVLRRFWVMPHALLAPFVVVALAWIADRIAAGLTLGRRTVEIAVAVAGFALVIAVMLSEWPRVSERDDRLARTFAEDLLRTIPPGGVLVAASDVVVLPVAYAQAVLHERPDVTVVMVGPLTRGAWGVRNLRARDPRLTVPFEAYDATRPGADLRALVDANPTRRFVLIGSPPDGSLEPAYWFVPHGLGLEIAPASRDVGLADLLAENEQLQRGYQPPLPDIAARDDFAPYVLRAYATAARQVAQQLLASQRAAEATVWLRRALAIDPTDPDARTLLGGG